MTDETDDNDLYTCERCEGEVAEMRTVIVYSRASSAAALASGIRTYEACWCESCANTHASPDDDGNLYTENAASAHGLYMHSDGIYRSYIEDEDEDSEEESDGLLSYDSDVIDVHGWPRRTKRTSLCFGVELEMEAKKRGSYWSLLSALGGNQGNGRYILKRDGSLGDGVGVELVTLPYTLEDHRSFFAWDKVLSAQVSNLAQSGSGTTACGMHVHVNRAVLSPLTIGKMLVFLNSAANEAFVTDVAQRKSNGYCERDAKKKATDYKRGDRYDILNVARKTVEFRLFRGNLRPERVLKNLEFCHALVRFCETHGLGEAAERSYFVQYVNANKKQYPHLAAFLIEKGWLDKPSPRSTAPHAQVLAKRERDSFFTTLEA